MVFSIPCLQAFLDPVPGCLATVRLTEALASLAQAVEQPTRQTVEHPGIAPVSKAGDRLVLLDERRQPIGWVSAQQLLHHLVASGLLNQLPTATDDCRKRAVDLPLLEIRPSIIEPLLVLPVDLAIDAFLPHLEQHPQACYALVDAEGSFVGLLDRSRLLQFLTTHSTLLHTVPSEPALPVTATSPFAVSHLAAFHSPLNPLLRELLEHLPLPVMLQTRDGQVLAQNSIWRTKISALLDPSWLRQEVAALLEMPLVEPSVVVSPSDHAPGASPEQSSLEQPSLKRSSLEWSSLETAASVTPREVWTATIPAASSPLEAWTDATSLEQQYVSDTTLSGDLDEGRADGAVSFLGASACQLGSKPGTCICVCPLKGGQEQVLQFVRIPLGTLSSQAAPALGDRVQTLATAVEAQFSHTSDSPSQLFRLAALLSTMHDSTSAPPAQSPAQSNDDHNDDRSEVALSIESGSHQLIPASEELWLILAQDVTEQQQLARELTAKNADLIQLNRLKDEFLACISHELRTPLTAVLGLSSLLKDQTLGALNERQVHYAQLIHQSGRHLMAVVNDILDLTRIETGQLELVLGPVDLGTVCQRAFEQAQQLRLEESKQAEDEVDQPTFSLALEPELKLVVADEQRLRQMLTHLLSNALKFTESNDPIGLKVSRWGGWIALTVWDTGIGIPDEKQHLIFQKFQQLENPLTRRFEGTGLGLVLTQRLARLHGGDVTFISKEGEGSQFTILLPPNPPQSPTSSHRGTVSTQNDGLERVLADRSHSTQTPIPDSAAKNSPPLATGNSALSVSALQRSQLVLLVEAVPPCIEVLSDELTGLGYRVVIARSGTEALEKARRFQPCIIFLNPVLPLLSGWDVLTLLKASAETQQIPVVVMATQVDEEQARQRQADRLLSLPIQPRALQKCLQILVVDRQAKPKPSPTAVLTVLRLSPGVWASPQQPPLAIDLNGLLHSCHCRVLEADDLEQAELLARVWKPNVVLLDGALADGSAYFRQYCKHIFLASLPLVTIDPATSQVANQARGLLVFPCLSAPDALLAIDPDMSTSALLQVIQIAAGYAWRPLVLALDALMLPMSLETQTPHPTKRRCDRSLEETEWLQALIQYLHTAELRGSVGRSWEEVHQQLESHSVDVLLICWTDAIAQAFTAPMLTALQQLSKRPPILVLDHRSHHTDVTADPIAPLPDPLRQLATQVLPASTPMPELLSRIQQAIKANKRKTPITIVTSN